MDFYVTIDDIMKEENINKLITCFRGHNRSNRIDSKILDRIKELVFNRENFYSIREHLDDIINFITKHLTSDNVDIMKWSLECVAEIVHDFQVSVSFNVFNEVLSVILIDRKDIQYSIYHCLEVLIMYTNYHFQIPLTHIIPILIDKVHADNGRMEIEGYHCIQFCLGLSLFGSLNNIDYSLYLMVSGNIDKICNCFDISLLEEDFNPFWLSHSIIISFYILYKYFLIVPNFSTENTSNLFSEAITPFLNSFHNAVTNIIPLGKHGHVFPKGRALCLLCFSLQIYKSLNGGLNRDLTESAEGAILEAIDVFEDLFPQPRNPQLIALERYDYVDINFLRTCLTEWYDSRR